MKRFVVDRLVDRENICNLVKEQESLRRYVQRGAKVVVYAPRNYGKTSLIKNVVIEEFRQRHKRCFVFFADLLSVRSLESLTIRLRSAFEHSFAESFPIKNVLENARHFLAALRPELSIDSLTGSPNLSLRVDEDPTGQTIRSIFRHARQIVEELPGLIVLDEFQDIARVEEAPGIFRSCFEEIASAPIIVLGSKRHLLASLFANPEAPLNGWGTDLEFQAIPYDEFHLYIEERFHQNNLTINYENARYLQDLLQRVPEAVNRLGQQIMDIHADREIGREAIAASLVKLLDNRASRYETYLGQFSASEGKVLLILAKQKVVAHPQSKQFLADASLSARAVGQIINRLMDRGVVEKIAPGYRLSDPLLAAYLRHYR
ncbi:MAG: ATP-binding protein [Spirochaetaceae bacterium]|nr:MAG: ATP-binding protein [Spirochaetaceae bacterium]